MAPKSWWDPSWKEALSALRPLLVIFYKLQFPSPLQDGAAIAARGNWLPEHAENAEHAAHLEQGRPVVHADADDAADGGLGRPI